MYIGDLKVGKKITLDMDPTDVEELDKIGKETGLGRSTLVKLRLKSPESYEMLKCSCLKDKESCRIILDKLKRR